MKKNEDMTNRTKKQRIIEGNYDVFTDEEFNSSDPTITGTRFFSEDSLLEALKFYGSKSNLIKQIPKILFTKNLAKSIVELSGAYLKYLPIEIIDKEIILIAAEQTVCVVKYIPQEYRTDEVYRMLFDLNPKVMKYIDKPSVSLCEYAINKNPLALTYIRDTSNLTDDLLKKIIERDWKNLKYIPISRLTIELCECAFDSDFNSFALIPDKFKTFDMCESAIKNDVMLLKYCPTSMISVEMCEKCVTDKYKLLFFVPENLKSESICLLALNQSPKAIEFFPKRYLTRRYLTKWFRINWNIFRYVPVEIVEPWFYKVVLEKVSFSKTFTNWLMSDEKYCRKENKDYANYKSLVRLSNQFQNDDIDYSIIKKERKLCLRRTISSCYNGETNVFEVKESAYKEISKRKFDNFDDFYQYLDANLSGSDLTEYDFSGIDKLSYKLDGAYLCSEILIEQNKYSADFYNLSIGRFSEETSLMPVLIKEKKGSGLIAHDEIYNGKLNSIGRKIYYITDIHLNHKLIERFPQCASYDEIRLFIEKYVKKMMLTAAKKVNDENYVMPYDSYLLIGGDVSFSFEVSKLFYTELCKYMDPSKIVVVLGNHELWDSYGCRETNSKKLIKDITDKYISLFAKLKITFLQYSLLVVKKHTYSIISGKNILCKSIDELHSIAKDSNMLIYGGIGFSAYNPEFNATHGIYRKTIASLESDMQYTQQSELVYYKLMDAFSKDKLIVFTHMPPKDWSRRELVPEWIYVNGHTHNNSFIQSEKCTVYADNQIGYKSGNIGLKYFKLNCEYDIFRYYPDGIFKISREQYFEFNHGVGVRCLFNRSVDYILMLKRQGVYLFLLEDNEKKGYICLMAEQPIV